MKQLKKMWTMIVVLAIFSTAKTSFCQVINIRTVEQGGTGRYSAVMITEASLPTHTIFRPKDMRIFNERNKLPIIVWGNGACYDSPWEHINFLNEIASHGFLVIAIGTMPKETGEQVKRSSQSSKLLDAIDWAITQNDKEKSPYYNKLDTTEIAVSGMSCGGLQALEVADDQRVTTLVVCNSGIFDDPKKGMPVLPVLSKDQLKKIHTPTLYLLGGESDIAYQNGMDDFKQINHVPVFVANMDVGHGGTYSRPHGGEFARVATNWFKWQLKDDREAARLFTGNPSGLSKSPAWTIDKKNTP